MTLSAEILYFSLLGGKRGRKGHPSPGLLSSLAAAGPRDAVSTEGSGGGWRGGAGGASQAGRPAPKSGPGAREASLPASPRLQGAHAAGCEGGRGPGAGRSLRKPARPGPAPDSAHTPAPRLRLPGPAPASPASRRDRTAAAAMWAALLLLCAGLLGAPARAASLPASPLGTGRGHGPGATLGRWGAPPGAPWRVGVREGRAASRGSGGRGAAPLPPRPGTGRTCSSSATRGQGLSVPSQQLPGGRRIGVRAGTRGALAWDPRGPRGSDRPESSSI